MKKFALIGASGFIAPRHMVAIRDTGNVLSAALDPHDSVGIMDSYFPEADFFTEFERFDRHLYKLSRQGDAIDYLSVCSPNYLHDSHIRFGLRSGADVICEKPLVLNPWNVDALRDMENETGRSVNTVLQLRVLPSIVALRERVLAENRSKKYEVELTYVTSRGHWYLQSWKGDDRKSGGIATNIGVHFFDMLHFIFGDVLSSLVHVREDTRASGCLEYENARVSWFLSTNSSDIPKKLLLEGQRTYRSITIDGDEIEFSEGFTDLHTRSYEQILEGNGFGLEESRAAIETVASIRTCEISDEGDFHPLMRDGL